MVLGLTFKEDVPDLRNSKVAEIVDNLTGEGHEIYVHDAYADPEEADRLYGIKLVSDFGSNFDCVAGCVMHSDYADIDLGALLKSDGLIVDIKGMWRKHSARKTFRYWSL